MPLVSRLLKEVDLDSNKASTTSTRYTHQQDTYTQAKVDEETLTAQTLMIIDDHEENLSLMKVLFESSYQVVTFDNAIDAIDYVQKGAVDIILLDINMPDMHGYDACVVLKSNPLTSHVPIIFVTASKSSESEAKGLSLGAVDYITKPLNLAVLRARVRNHMESVYYRRQLEILSSVDGLTGLANRRKLDSMLQLHYSSTLRFCYCMTLMVIDIDDFKAYNDKYGHIQGDDCIRRIAHCLEAQCRETDFVGRYGGEEFVMVLPDTDLEGGLTMANKLLRAVRKLDTPNISPPCDVTVSIGLAILDGSENIDDQHTVESLIELADEHLYKAKRSGKDKVCHHLSSANVQEKVQEKAQQKA